MSENNIKILIVDDSLFVLDKLTSILKNADFDVVGRAKSGIEAIKLYTQVLPDIVIMDINMNDMDGISAVKFIIQTDPKAKIIMCTSVNTKNNVIDSFKAGAKNLIVKPFSPKKIVAVVKATYEK